MNKLRLFRYEKSVMVLGVIAFILVTAICYVGQISLTKSNETVGAKNVASANADSAVDIKDLKYPNQPVYKMAVEAGYAPFALKDKDDNITGFDVEVLKAIGDAEKINIEIYSRPWEGIFDTLTKGTSTIVGSGVIVTPERSKKLNMVPFLSTQTLMVYPIDDKHKSINEFASIPVGVQSDSVYVKELKKQFGKNTNLKTYPSTEAALEALFLGEVKGVYDDKAVLSYLFNTKFKGKKVHIMNSTISAPYDIGFAVAKDNKVVTDKLKSGLSKIKADGTYDRIYTKWLGENF